MYFGKQKHNERWTSIGMCIKPDNGCKKKPSFSEYSLINS